MEHGVTFEINGIEKHSSYDFDLEFVSYDLTFPEPKSDYAEVEGADGSVDLTEVFGRIFYKDRELTLNFNCGKGFNETIREISAFVHGKVAKITIFDDEEYYYLGRLRFDKYSSDYVNGKVILKAKCYPYKYKQNISVSTNSVKNVTYVNYHNERMEAVPTFKATDDMIMEFNGKTYALGTSEIIYPDIVFKEGDNFIEYHGNGIVEVSWQEGAF